MDKNPAIIIAVFVRLFAIGLVIYLLQVLGLEYSAAANFEDYKVNLVLGVIVAFVALLAVFLWKFPLFVASKLLNFESTEIPKASISEESILLFCRLEIIFVSISPGRVSQGGYGVFGSILIHHYVPVISEKGRN